MAIECTHGRLARSCEICERDALIAELEGELQKCLQVLRQVSHAVYNNNSVDVSIRIKAIERLTS